MSDELITPSELPLPEPEVPYPEVPIPYPEVPYPEVPIPYPEVPYPEVPIPYPEVPYPEVPIPYPEVPYPEVPIPYPEVPYPETPVDTGPTYITTLEELVSTQGAIIQKESVDKTSLLSVFQPTPNTLKTRLVVWASLGFPANGVVFSVQINPPTACSDGRIRAFYEYVLYLLTTPIEPFLTTLNSQVPGVTFNFFLSDTNTIGLNVSKA